MRVDIVVPIYNEAEVIWWFHRRLRGVLDRLPHNVHVYYVNDGSQDETANILKEVVESDARCTAVHLSRNFGHQAALTAGLRLTTGDVVITMDGDGQHPPELIPKLIAHIADGSEIVNAQRMGDKNVSLFKRATSGCFYALMNLLGNLNLAPGSADFRAVRREVVDALNEMGEYHRFLRGMVAWVGFRVASEPYAAPPRAAGSTKYSLAKMLRLAMDGIFSFSLVPLQLALFVGLAFFVLALAEAAYVLWLWLRGAQSQLAPGWSSLMFIMLIIGGTLMLSLGVIGIYVGYIFQEVKRRPVYIIRNIDQNASTEHFGKTRANTLGAEASNAEEQPN